VIGNVPSDWHSYWINCPCGRRYHASDGRCSEDTDVEGCGVCDFFDSDERLCELFDETHDPNDDACEAFRGDADA